MRNFLMVFVLMPLIVWADTWVDPSTGIEWNYIVENGTVKLGGVDNYRAIPTETVGSVTIPSSIGGLPVTSIGQSAFWTCHGLTSIVIPLGVTSIEYSAFNGCSGLTFIEIPEGVTNIGYRAFLKCTGLRSMTIAASVTSIGAQTFYGCSSLKDVYFKGVNPPELGAAVFDGCDSDLVCHAPKGWKGRSRILGGVYLLVEGKEEEPSDVDMPLVTCLYDISFGSGTCYVTNSHEFAFIRMSIVPKLMPLDEALILYPAVLNEFDDKCEKAGLPESVTAANCSRWQEAMAVSFFTGFGELLKSRNQAHIGRVGLCVTNVSVNYILNSVQPHFAIPASSDTGFVNIITEVKGGVVAVPSSWADNYQNFTTKFGSDFTKALAMKTGKKDGAGNDMLVWQDYVAGTDPTKEDDVFKASITIVDGKVTISYTPELDAERRAMRKYTTWGKKSLLDLTWREVPEGHESEYNFFKISVEMK